MKIQELAEDEGITVTFAFIHKVINKMEVANSIYNKLMPGYELDWDSKNALKMAKDSCISYLGDFESGKVSLPSKLLEKYPADKLREAYKKADFDWTDRTKYFEFQGWFLGKKEKAI